MKSILSTLLVALLAVACLSFPAHAKPVYSFDYDSPSFDSQAHWPGDILAPAIFTQVDFRNLDYNLTVSEELDALSDGTTADFFKNADKGLEFGAGRLFFSVTRGSDGQPGTALRAEEDDPSDEQSGDVFVTGFRLPAPYLWLADLNTAADAASFGYIGGIPDRSDIAGHGMFMEEYQLGMVKQDPLYGTDNLDAFNLEDVGEQSEPAVPLFWSVNDSMSYGDDQAAILTVSGGVRTVAATAAQLGLLGNVDNVDAFVLWDANADGLIEPGVDMGLFSLEAESETLTNGGPFPRALKAGDVFVTSFRGTFDLYAGFQSLGLQASDDLDALAYEPVPEPATIALVGIGLMAIQFAGGRCCRRAIK